MRNASKQQGFTLVESVIVVAIIAILASWAFPSYIDMRDRMAVRAAGEDFLSSLAEAKFAAAKESTPKTLDFSTTINKLPRGVTLTEATTIGGSSSTPGKVVIEPRLGLLATPGDAGKYELKSGGYYLRFELSPVAMGRLCDPGTGKKPGVPSC